MEKANHEKAPIIEIEKVLKKNSPKYYKFIPRFVVKWLKKTIHQDIVNEVIIKHHKKNPYEFATATLNHFGVNRITKGAENLPPNNKRMVFVANHPLGGLDGMAFIEAVHKIYGDLRFPVNSLLLNVPALNQVFLPINKLGKQSRESLIAIDKAFEGDLPILYFPAGLCSRKTKRKISDLEWKKTFITQAIKHKRKVVPVFINGKNSNFFYNLSNFRKNIGLKFNIEMLYLVDEMVKQNNKNLIVNFGKPIDYKIFIKDKPITHWVDFVRQKTYEMENIYDIKKNRKLST